MVLKEVSAGTEGNCVLRISPRSTDTHRFMTWRHVGRRYEGRVRTTLAESDMEFPVVPSFNNSETVVILRLARHI